jgi:hypothetical protein
MFSGNGCCAFLPTSLLVPSSDSAAAGFSAVLVPTPWQVQKIWMYLEPILSAPDIQKQLPAESKAFDLVHKQLKDVMRRTKDRPNALQTAGSTSEVPMWLHTQWSGNREWCSNACVAVHLRIVLMPSHSNTGAQQQSL